MTIQESLYLYKQQKLAVGISHETVERVIINVNMLCKDMSIKRIISFSTEKVLQWGDMKRSKGLKSSTLSAYYNSIRSYVNFVRSIGLQIDVNNDRIHCKARYGRRRALQTRDVKKIIEHADEQTAVLIHFMYMTGLRISEAVSVTQDYLQDGTTIYIIGKGNKERPVFIDELMLDNLTAMAKRNHGPVFIDAHDNQLSKKKAYYYIKKAMFLAGFPDASPHILRHTFATELLRKGASLAHTSRLMGHSTVAVTQIYTHLLTDDIRKAHKLLTKIC